MYTNTYKSIFGTKIGQEKKTQLKIIAYIATFTTINTICNCSNCRFVSLYIWIDFSYAIESHTHRTRLHSSQHSQSHDFLLFLIPTTIYAEMHFNAVVCAIEQTSHCTYQGVVSLTCTLFCPFVVRIICCHLVTKECNVIVTRFV